jgi:hypothetical protein
MWYFVWLMAGALHRYLVFGSLQDLPGVGVETGELLLERPEWHGHADKLLQQPPVPPQLAVADAKHVAQRYLDALAMITSAAAMQPGEEAEFAQMSRELEGAMGLASTAADKRRSECHSGSEQRC